MNGIPTIVTRNVVRVPASDRDSPNESEILELPIPPREEREPNPVFVELLKGATKFLWDGDEATRNQHYSTFICDALEELQELHSVSAITKLQRFIERSLGTASYGGWVMHQFERSAWISLLKSPDARMRIQAGRLRWMNQLIEEFGGTP